MTRRLGFDFQGKLCSAQGNPLLLSSRPDPDFEPIWQFRRQQNTARNQDSPRLLNLNGSNNVGRIYIFCQCFLFLRSFNFICLALEPKERASIKFERGNTDDAFSSHPHQAGFELSSLFRDCSFLLIFFRWSALAPATQRYKKQRRTSINPRQALITKQVFSSFFPVSLKFLHLSSACFVVGKKSH